MTWTLLGGYFIFVAAAVAFAGYVYTALSSHTNGSQASVLGGSALTGSAAAGGGSVITEILRSVGERGPGYKEGSNLLRRQLAAAGYRYPAAMSTYCGIKNASAFVVGGLLGWISYLNQHDLLVAFVATIAAGGFAHMLPDRILSGMVRSRMGRIREAIPVALDLLVLSVEAGQSLNQAIVDTSAELHDAYPDLSAELAQVHLELRAGRSRYDALHELGERNPEPELRKLANVLIDADRFGTSLAPALRTHAKYLRRRTRQQAQGAARKVAVKLIFPVFFLIFPSVLLVTLGPAVLKMSEQFRKLIGP
ncbi:MAG: type II secretion system F family protein [Bryobacteraceae bacterium]